MALAVTRTVAPVSARIAGHRPVMPRIVVTKNTALSPKRRFSEFSGEASCNQEYACALQQRLDDEPKPIIAEGKALVLKHPGVAALNGPAPLAQSRSVWIWGLTPKWRQRAR